MSLSHSYQELNTSSSVEKPPRTRNVSQTIKALNWTNVILNMGLMGMTLLSETHDVVQIVDASLQVVIWVRFVSVQKLIINLGTGANMYGLVYGLSRLLTVFQSSYILL